MAPFLYYMKTTFLFEIIKMVSYLQNDFTDALETSRKPIWGMNNIDKESFYKKLII